MADRPKRAERFRFPFPDFVPLFGRILAGEGSRVGDGVPCLPAERLFEAAVHHKVAGQLVETSRQEPALAAAIGERDLVRLEGHHSRSVLWTRALRIEFARIAPALTRAAGTTPILLKGAGAAALYGNPSLRTSADIDLLVPVERLGPCAGALREEGYELFIPPVPPAMRGGHHLVFRRPAGKRAYLVELHWRVGDDPCTDPLDYAAIRTNATTMALEGNQVVVPDLSDQILLLSLHLLLDAAKVLESVNDIRLASGHADEGSWSGAFERARWTGLLWPLNRALDYVEHVFDETLNRPSGPGRRPRFGPLVATECHTSRAARHLGKLAAAPGRRAEYVKGLLLPTRQQMLGVLGEDVREPGRGVRLRYYARAVRTPFRQRRGLT